MRPTFPCPHCDAVFGDEIWRDNHVTVCRRVKASDQPKILAPSQRPRCSSAPDAPRRPLTSPVHETPPLSPASEDRSPPRMAGLRAVPDWYVGPLLHMLIEAEVSDTVLRRSGRDGVGRAARDRDRLAEETRADIRRRFTRGAP